MHLLMVENTVPRWFFKKKKNVGNQYSSFLLLLKSCRVSRLHPTRWQQVTGGPCICPFHPGLIPVFIPLPYLLPAWPTRHHSLLPLVRRILCKPNGSAASCLRGGLASKVIDVSTLLLGTGGSPGPQPPILRGKLEARVVNLLWRATNLIF